MKFNWTPTHCEAFFKLKASITEAPILHYPDPNKRHIVYTDASDDASGVQLSQEHDGTEFLIAFLSHTFLETQRKWSTTGQEDYGVYYAITKWNYYLQGANIIVQNDHKPLNKFINGKNANYYYHYVHSYIALNEFYTIIWYAYLLKHFIMKFY